MVYRSQIKTITNACIIKKASIVLLMTHFIL